MITYLESILLLGFQSYPMGMNILLYGHLVNKLLLNYKEYQSDKG